MFPFRNMQTFIRNCIEPHVVSINKFLTSQILTNKKWTQEEIAALKKSQKEEIDRLIEMINKQLADQDAAITEKIDGLSSIEIGWISFWPTDAIPTDIDKWLFCDGSTFVISKYPRLFDILQTNRLPDYRGHFLRCIGGNASPIGVKQNMEIQAHNHPVNLQQANAEGGGIWAYPKFDGYDGNISTLTTGGIETRPVNTAVKYYIRALT